MAIIRKAKRVKSTEGDKDLELNTPKRIRDLAQQREITTAPIDLKSIVKLFGIKLKTRSLDDEISGYLAREDDGWIIVVNSLHHPKRQRFTLAHELAHYALHRQTQDKFIDKKLFRNGDSNPMEVEANRFAAELLMPDEDFRNYVEHHSSKVEDLADRFEVSALAVRVRAKELGYSGHGLS